jgi:hypothetical protein
MGHPPKWGPSSERSAGPRGSEAVLAWCQLGYSSGGRLTCSGRASSSSTKPSGTVLVTGGPGRRVGGFY